MDYLIYKITPPPLLPNLSFLNIIYPVIPNSASDISGEVIGGIRTKEDENEDEDSFPVNTRVKQCYVQAAALFSFLFPAVFVDAFSDFDVVCVIQTSALVVSYSI